MNAVPCYSLFLNFKRVAKNVEIVVLNLQKYDHCFKGHKSLGSLFDGVL